MARFLQFTETAGVRVVQRLAEEVTLMKYSFLAACGAVALASTVTLSAQTPAQPPTTRPQTPAPTQPATRTDQGSVTVTGCLKSDNAMGGGATDPMAKPGDPMAKPGDPMGKPGAPMTNNRWVLTNVQADKAMGQTPSPSPGATTSPAHPQASQYVVTAGTGVNLSAHVNHQVRITGTVAGGMDHGSMTPANKAGDKPMARPGDAKPGMPADHMNMGSDNKSATLTATSVTMISATCTTTAQQ